MSKWLVHVTTEGTGASEECNIMYTSVYVYDTKDEAVAAARKAMPGGKEEYYDYDQTVHFTDSRDNFLLVARAAEGDIQLYVDEDEEE